MRLSFLFLLFFSVTGYSANLQLPKEISIVSINGQPYQNSFFSSDTNISLTQGQQLLVLEYQDIFENYDDDDHSKIKSEPYVVIFTVGEQDKLSLKLPEITNEAQARDFANTFNVDLVNGLSQEHPVFIQDLMKYKAGLMVNHSVMKPAFIATNKITERVPQYSDNTLAKLKHLWQLANEKQKRQFMQYLLLQQQMEPVAQTKTEDAR